MDASERLASDGSGEGPSDAETASLTTPHLDPAASAWVAALPAPPFVSRAAPDEPLRFVRVSPRVAILIAAMVVVGTILWMARDSIRPFIVGLLIVYLLEPPVHWLTRHGFRRSLAILFVYVVAVVAFIEFMGLTLTPLVNEFVRFVQDLPGLTAQFQAQVARLTDIYTRLQLPAALRDWLDSMIAGFGQVGPATPAGNLSFVLPLLTGAGGVIASLFGYLLLPVWSFYLLKDRGALTAQFDRSLPAAWRFDTWAVLRIIQRVFGQWVRGQLILGLTVGLMTFVGLLILSRLVDPVFGRYAVLLSVTAGILELLPIIGPIISAVPAVLLAATAGLEPVIAALILYTLVQQLENNLLVPKIQGDAVELHPAAVMFSIIVGGALAGLLGAILALPIAAALRDVVRYLFRRLSPEDPGALAATIEGLRLDRHVRPANDGVGTI